MKKKILIALIAAAVSIVSAVMPTLAAGGPSSATCVSSAAGTACDAVVITSNWDECKLSILGVDPATGDTTFQISCWDNDEVPPAPEEWSSDALAALLGENAPESINDGMAVWSLQKVGDETFLRRDEGDKWMRWLTAEGEVVCKDGGYDSRDGFYNNPDC